MAEHTPGPWQVGTEEFQTMEIFAGDANVATCWEALAETGPEGANANARLIAAAPEMLAELRKAEAYIDLQTSDPRNAKLACQDLTSLRAVIAKATGEQS